MATEKLYATIGTEVREFTEAEYAQHELDMAAVKKAETAKAKADKIKAEKRQIILDRLGITNEELLEILS